MSGRVEGFLSNNLVMIPLILGETVSGNGLSLSFLIASLIAHTFSCLKGLTPVINSWKMIPRAHISTFSVAAYLLITSGAVYAGVERKPKVDCFIFMVYKSTLDIPKSPILRIWIPPKLSTSIFAGFKSLCMIFLLCRKCNPMSIITIYCHASDSLIVLYFLIRDSKSPSEANYVTIQSYFSL